MHSYCPVHIMKTYYSLNQVKMEICKEDIRKLLYFQYKLSANASKATPNMHHVRPKYTDYSNSIKLV